MSFREGERKGEAKGHHEEIDKQPGNSNGQKPEAMKGQEEGES